MILSDKHSKIPTTFLAGKIICDILAPRSSKQKSNIILHLTNYALGSNLSSIKVQEGASQPCLVCWKTSSTQKKSPPLLDTINHLYQSHGGATGLIQPCRLPNVSIIDVESWKHFSCHENTDMKTMVFWSYLETAVNTKVRSLARISFMREVALKALEGRYVQCTITPCDAMSPVL